MRRVDSIEIMRCPQAQDREAVEKASPHSCVGLLFPPALRYAVGSVALNEQRELTISVGDTRHSAALCLPVRIALRFRCSTGLELCDRAAVEPGPQSFLFAQE